MSKKNKKNNNEPPSLFDSLDLFADAGATDGTPAADADTDARQRVPPAAVATSCDPPLGETASRRFVIPHLF